MRPLLQLSFTGVPLALALLFSARADSSGDLGHIYPKNLLRYHAGADWFSVPHSSDPLFSSDLTTSKHAPEVSLLTDDPILTTLLPKGHTEWQFRLHTHWPVSRLTFRVEGVEGKVTVATSLDDPKLAPSSWKRAGNASFSKADSGVELRLLPSIARYIHLSFDLVQPGRIGGLGLFGSYKAVDFRPIDWESDDSTREPIQGGADPRILVCSLTNGRSTSTVHGMSSAGSADDPSLLMDEDSLTAYTFAADDPMPRFIIDLGRKATLSRLSMLKSAGPGTLRIWPLTHAEAVRGHYPADAVHAKACTPLSSDSQRLVTDLSITAEALAFSWTPSGAQSESLQIYEIAIFPERPPSSWDEQGYGKNPPGTGKNPIDSPDGSGSRPTRDASGASSSVAGQYSQKRNPYLVGHGLFSNGILSAISTDPGDISVSFPGGDPEIQPASR